MRNCIFEEGRPLSDTYYYVDGERFYHEEVADDSLSDVAEWLGFELQFDSEGYIMLGSGVTAYLNTLEEEGPDIFKRATY